MTYPLATRAFPFLLALLFALPLHAQDVEHIPGELIIRLNSEASIDALNSPDLSELGLYPIRNLVPSRNIWLVGFDENMQSLSFGRSAEDVLRSTRAASDIMLAQFNTPVQLRHPSIVEEDAYVSLDDIRANSPNDTRFPEMWGLNNTGQTGGTPGADVSALEAWEISTGGIAVTGEQLVVAVIDSGFALGHPDVHWWKNENESPTPNGQDTDENGYIDDYNGWNAYNNSGVITSSHHGTHVAGTIGARGNNNLGIVGVNWDVGIMPIQGSSSSQSTVVAAYGYALTMRELYDETNGEKGALVVATNSSFGVDFGNPANYPIWCGMYDEMGEAGIISAGATANANWDIDATGDVPTACPSDYLIAVTNTTHHDVKSSGAGYGLETIDLGAPGSSILSTTPSTSYGTSSGTSMATPHVAGAVALMFSAMTMEMFQAYRLNPGDGALLVRQAILDGVDDIGLQVATGGRLNLYGALEALSLAQPPLVAPELDGGSLAAGYFDGSSSLITPFTNRFPTSGEMSLALWAQIESPGTLAELATEEGTVATRIVVVQHEGDLVLGYSYLAESGAFRTQVFTETPLTEGLHHIFLTRSSDPQAVRMHLDGERVGNPYFLTDPPEQFSITAMSIGNSFDESSGITATIDEVRVYNTRKLSNELYDVHASFPYDDTPSDVVAYYRFSADSTGYIFDFSGNNSGADWDGSLETSPFPVGATSNVLLVGNPTGTVGEAGASISAEITNPGAGNRVAIYTYDFSDETIPADDLPWWYMAYSELAWGAHLYSDASANLVIDFEALQSEDNIVYGLLYRADPQSEWVEVTSEWTQGESSFSAEGLTESGQWAIAFGPSVDTEDQSTTSEASLSQVFPNPSVHEATVTLELPESSDMTIELFDILGRRVLVVHDGLVQSGSTNFTINSEQLAPGTYVLRAAGAAFTGVRQITVVK